jgi:hypothetical protein
MVEQPAELAALVGAFVDDDLALPNPIREIHA